MIHSAGLGLSHPDAFLLFPLSQKFLLQASWPKHFPGDYQDLRPEQVRHLNIELIKKAGLEAYSGRDTKEFQDLVDEFMTSHHPRKVEHQVQSPDGRIFTGVVELSLEEAVQLGETAHPRAKEKFLGSLPAFQAVDKELQAQRDAWRGKLLNSNQDNPEVF
ncbi:hypothetical protein IV102_18155 [bacterium]|nr:hypothetical protein [bacterium]